MAQNLLRDDAKDFFANNILSIYEFWLDLIRRTTLPTNLSYTDPSWIAAFQSLDNIIEGDMHPQSRLAYFQLTHVMASLKKSVQNDRRYGRIESKVGQRDANIALDIYLKAQGVVSNHKVVRQRLHKRLRISKRWAHFAWPSPLLILTHSKMADRIM
ncbi:hypothetical protein N657DRAFT_551789, partial [Parathielavia appendiculata]